MEICRIRGKRSGSMNTVQLVFKSADPISGMNIFWQRYSATGSKIAAVKEG